MMSLQDSLIAFGMSSDTFALRFSRSNQLYFRRIFFGILFVKTKVNASSDLYDWRETVPNSPLWEVRIFRRSRCCGSNTRFRHYGSFRNYWEYLIPVIESEQIT